MGVAGRKGGRTPLQSINDSDSDNFDTYDLHDLRDLVTWTRVGWDEMRLINRYT